jgi:hypothetical protein
MDCDRFRDDMLDVLYGEAGEAAARRVDAHQASCPECRQEMSALRRLRGDLAHWRVPDATSARPGTTRRSAAPLVLAAAAVVVLALGALVVVRTDVRYDNGAVVARFGVPADDASPAVGARRDEEIAALRAEVMALSRRADEARILATVAGMIRESEARQETARETRLNELVARVDTQRQYDLARVSAGFAYLDGKAGLQAARTTELVGQMFQASQQK